MTDDWSDEAILQKLRLRHWQPMPHGTTELLCLKAAELIERLTPAARIGASVMPRPIVLDDLRLWNSDVTLTNGELKLQFDNAQDADKMCDFLLALAEIKHALPKPQVTP